MNKDINKVTNKIDSIIKQSDLRLGQLMTLCLDEAKNENKDLFYINEDDLFNILLKIENKLKK